MKAWKALKYAFGGIVGLLLLLVVFVVAINAVDEDLNPEILDLVRRAEADTIIQEGNAYYPIRGFFAPTGKDIEVTGKGLANADQSAFETFRKEGRLDQRRVPAVPNELKFKGDSWNLCTVTDESKYDNGKCKSKAESDRMFQENAELLARYYGLLDYRSYEEPGAFSTFSSGDLIGVMRLANADMERKLVAGDIEEATQLLSRNLSFWRNALNGKYRLISEAILSVNYSYSLTTLSDLLPLYPALGSRKDIRSALAQPIELSGMRLQAQMDREFMNVYYVKEGSDWLFRGYSGNEANPFLKWAANVLYQKNATLNKYHACLRAYYSVRELAGSEYSEAESRFEDFDVDGMWDLTYNPTGNVALLSICPKRSWLGSLVWEQRFEARRRLAVLQIKLLSSNAPISRYSGLLDDSGPDLHDPITGRPAQWDADQRIIYFQREGGCVNERLWARMGPTKKFSRCPS